jgi:hypothetical protein
MASINAPTEDQCALSVGQEALWFLHSLAPGSSAYNTSAALTLDFDVDVADQREMGEVVQHDVVGGDHQHVAAGVRTQQ